MKAKFRNLKYFLKQRIKKEMNKPWKPYKSYNTLMAESFFEDDGGYTAYGDNLYNNEPDEDDNPINPNWNGRIS